MSKSGLPIYNNIGDPNFDKSEDKVDFLKFSRAKFENRNMRAELRAFPLQKFLLEMKLEGQDEKTTMEHLQICKEKCLLDYDSTFIYGVVYGDLN